MTKQCRETLHMAQKIWEPFSKYCAFSCLNMKSFDIVDNTKKLCCNGVIHYVTDKFVYLLYEITEQKL